MIDLTHYVPEMHDQVIHVCKVLARIEGLAVIGYRHPFSAWVLGDMYRAVVTCEVRRTDGSWQEGIVVWFNDDEVEEVLKSFFASLPERRLTRRERLRRSLMGTGVFASDDELNAFLQED